MADQEELQRIATDPTYYQQLLSQAAVKPQPQTHRNYDEERNKMMKDKIWWTLGSKTYVPDLKKISDIYNVPRHCLNYWRSQLKENINWLPDQAHADSNRVFSAKQEKEMANTILQYADNGVQITNGIMRNVLLLKNQENMEAENENAIKPQQLQFAASDFYLAEFCKRNELSRRRAHLKKRPKIKPHLITDYRERMTGLFEDPQIRNDHILNCDETFWHQSEQSNYTIAQKGQDNVHIYTDANEKAGTTILATVDSTGGKLPLLIIGKGKTDRCEKSQIGFSNPIGQTNPNPYSDMTHYTARSQTGWMNDTIWTRYLENLREQRPYDPQYPQDAKENKIFLACDSFAVHHDSASVRTAEKYNIELIKIPEGCTDECQPLDRRVFGGMKQQARAETHKEIAKSIVDSMKTGTPVNIKRPTKPESIGNAIRIWDKYPQPQIVNAWTLSLNGCEKGQNEDV